MTDGLSVWLHSPSVWLCAMTTDASSSLDVSRRCNYKSTFYLLTCLLTGSKISEYYSDNIIRIIIPHHLPIFNPSYFVAPYFKGQFAINGFYIKLQCLDSRPSGFSSRLPSPLCRFGNTYYWNYKVKMHILDFFRVQQAHSVFTYVLTYWL